jgi:hypothetical protein
MSAIAHVRAVRHRRDASATTAERRFVDAIVHVD